jgi:hypothetical protein
MVVSLIRSPLHAIYAGFQIDKDNPRDKPIQLSDEQDRPYLVNGVGLQVLKAAVYRHASPLSPLGVQTRPCLVKEQRAPRIKDGPSTDMPPPLISL